MIRNMSDRKFKLKNCQKGMRHSFLNQFKKKKRVKETRRNMIFNAIIEELLKG